MWYFRGKWEARCHRVADNILRGARDKHGVSNHQSRFFIPRILPFDDYHSSLGIFAVVSSTGIASTFLLEETVDQSLEVLSLEPQQEHDQGMPIVPVCLCESLRGLQH
jgi:hypothetical protein